MIPILTASNGDRLAYMRFFWAICMVASAAEIPAPWKPALDRVTADSLRGHLSFLASDLLEGRDTPSRGLDIAAEYIAAQFRRAGLEPAGDDGYFQTARRAVVEPDPVGFELSMETPSGVIRVAIGQVILQAAAAGEVAGIEAIRVKLGDTSALTPEQAGGKVIVAEFPEPDPARRQELFRNFSQLMSAATKLQAPLVILSGGGGFPARLLRPTRLIDPANRPPAGALPPTLVMTDPGAIEALAAATKITAHWNAPREKPVTLRNVAGLLRGSDPALKDTAVLVTAHYDHVGVAAGGDGDRIFNGANDDGSGTVGVIELAGALASLPARPKRSVVFVTFFGEEKGGLGSRHYVQNPVIPVEKTVANLNLEQIGRTDSTDGPQLNNLTITGFDYSNVSEFFIEAGRSTAIEVYKHEKNSDPYFTRSDNATLAQQGIPAHSITTAFQYPDYHGAGDHWDKINYDNMEKVTRAIALATLLIADSAEEPRWNESNPRAERYFQSWKKRREK